MDNPGTLVWLLLLFVTLPLWAIAWNIHDLTKELKRQRERAGKAGHQ